MSTKQPQIELFNAFKEGFRDFTKYSEFGVDYAKGVDHVNCRFDGRLKIELPEHDSPTVFLKACGGQEVSEGFLFKVGDQKISVYPLSGDEGEFEFEGITTLWVKDISPSKAERLGQRMADAVTGLVDMLQFYSRKRRAM